MFLKGNKEVNTEEDQDVSNQVAHPPFYDCYMDPDCEVFAGHGDCCFFPEIFYENDLGQCLSW